MPPDSMEIDDREYEKPNIKEDGLNFALMTFLYVLQGAVVGVVNAIPLVLQKRNVTYTDQAEYSVVMYPFSLKMLWAPIVDSTYYWKRVGRRKSWLIPTQYFIGILLLVMSMNIDHLLGTEDGARKPNVPVLTTIFFFCIFFAATQDIAVDGWSLTIFKKKNIGYSAPSQSIGFKLGHFLAYTGFIVLDSKDLCNLIRSAPKDHGLVTFSEFICFWSIACLITTTFILFFKKENGMDTTREKQKRELGIKETYRHLWMVVRIRPVQIIGLFLLTWPVGFATGKVASLKLIDAGLPRDRLVLLSIPSIPFQFILPFVLRRYVTGPRPMRLFLILYFLKLINCVLYASFVFFILNSKSADINEPTPTWYYWPLIFIYNFNDVVGFVMKTTLFALFARISDPRFGGVYLTLLNSMNNFGHRWPSTICLWLVDFLTIKSCSPDEIEGATCYTNFDGYYTEVIVFTMIGAIWMIFWGKRLIQNLEKMDSGAFMVNRTCI